MNGTSKNRRRIAPFYIKNELGIPDVAQRLHWDSSWAKAIGNPMAYDYGVLRQSWFYHQVSDWAGDDAFIERIRATCSMFLARRGKCSLIRIPGIDV